MSETNTTITSQLEGFLESAKRLETELNAERKKNQKIAQDYLTTRSTLENAVRTLQSDLNAKKQEIFSLTQSLQGAKANEDRLTAKTNEIAAQTKRIGEELARYQNAWTQVLARESAANEAINACEKMKIEANHHKLAVEQAQRHMDEMAKRAAGAERQLKITHQELQNLHAKYNALSRDFQALTQVKRQMDEEIAKKTRDENTQIQELKLALEKAKFATNDLASKNTHLQEEADLNLSRAKSQIVALNEQIISIRRAQHEDSELRDQKIAQFLERAVKAERLHAQSQDAITEMRSRIEEQDKIISLLQLDKTQSHAKAEETRKQLNKTMLIERLKHETELTAMKAKLESELKRAAAAKAEAEARAQAAAMEARVRAEIEEIEVDPAEETLGPDELIVQKIAEAPEAVVLEAQPVRNRHDVGSASPAEYLERL